MQFRSYSSFNRHKTTYAFTGNYFKNFLNIFRDESKGEEIELSQALGTESNGVRFQHTSTLEE